MKSKKVKVGQRWQYVHTELMYRQYRKSGKSVIVQILDDNVDPMVRCLQIIGKFDGWEVGEETESSIKDDRRWKLLAGQETP